MRISEPARLRLRGALQQATTSAGRSAILVEWARAQGVSLQTAYYHAGGMGRRRRQDAGKPRVVCNEDVYKDAAAITAQTDAHAELAMHMAGLTGISGSTFRRRLRADGLSRAELKSDRRVYRRFEAPRSNALHQIDATRSVLYYIWRGGRIRRLDVPAYKNKPREELDMLHVFMLVDDHSRCRYARYYTSDNAVNWVDFLLRAWTRKPGWPFYGVPDKIYCDNGSAFKANDFKRPFASEHLNIGIIHSLPRYSQGRGKVERSIGIFEQDFEKVIQIRSPQGCPDIDALNTLAEDYILWRNGRRHSETLEIPFTRWRRGIDPTRFRDVPDERIQRYLRMTQHAYQINPYCEIRIGDGTGRQHYYSLNKVPLAADYRGQKVPVYISPGDWTRITVTLGDVDYEVMESGRLVNDLDSYECAPSGERSKRLLEVTTRKVVSDRSWPRPAAADEPWIPPAERPIVSVMFERAPAQMSLYDGQTEADRLMRARVGRGLREDEYPAFLARFSGSGTVTMDDVRAWVEELIGKEAEDGNDAAAVGA